jgi:site-specific recombinase XerD
MEAILDAPDPRTRMGIRDRAMLHVGVASGLRVSELVGLRVEDVSFDPWPCIGIQGKGRREPRLPLWKESGAVLRQWLAIRGAASDPALFLNARGQAMSRAGFAFVLRKHARRSHAETPSGQLGDPSASSQRAVHGSRSTHRPSED